MERAAPRSPIWPCTRWGLPCLRACARSGGLLLHLFTLTHLRSQILKSQRAVCFLWHFPWRRLAASSSACIPQHLLASARRLRGIAPYGVRTFLPCPLSRPGAILHPSGTGKTIAHIAFSNKGDRTGTAGDHRRNALRPPETILRQRTSTGALFRRRRRPCRTHQRPPVPTPKHRARAVRNSLSLPAQRTVGGSDRRLGHAVNLGRNGARRNQGTDRGSASRSNASAVRMLDPLG